ncbi:hypothetical protein SDC9_119114 [bioreactor metagenome]|uniref:Uncharacterized protein n=1 Tax=bioreactor metagenome TaxID=1076179 RepID=A0A645C588_9ZZZZ
MTLHNEHDFIALFNALRHKKRGKRITFFGKLRKRYIAFFAFVIYPQQGAFIRCFLCYDIHNVISKIKAFELFPFKIDQLSVGAGFFGFQKTFIHHFHLMVLLNYFMPDLIG